MKLNDDFMRHFRWITPLLLAFTVFILQNMYFEFQKVKEELQNQRMDMVAVKTYIWKKLER